MSKPATHGPSTTGRVEDLPIDYTVEIRGTNDRGAEVVVYLVNEDEPVLTATDVEVEYAVDGDWRGRHAVYFHDADHRGRVRLEQYVVAEGHFHIPDLGSAAELRTRVFLQAADDEHVERAKVSQRLETRSFRGR